MKGVSLIKQQNVWFQLYFVMLMAKLYRNTLISDCQGTEWREFTGET